MIDVIECYGRMILEDNPYEVGSGIKIKGQEEEAIVHIGNYKTLLMRPQRNTYGIRPIFDIGCYMQPELFWDIGLVDLTKNIQHRLDQIANLKTHNAMMMINSMFRVDPDSDIPPESLIWRPFGIVPAYEGELDQIPVQDINPHLFAQMEQFYDETIQDIMGMYDYNMGATPQRQERVGTIYSIQSMGEARAKLLLMSMDYLGIRPLLKYLMVLNTFHLPSGFEYRISQQDEHTFGNIFGEDIHPDFDFAARYSATEPALAKEFRAQQLIQMAQLWMQSPWINQHQFTKLLMELLDVRERDQLMKTPEQIQQEMQQQAQSQMMAEQMKQRYETEGKLITSQQDFKEELALNEQEFQHDMTLEAIKQNEKSAE